MVFKDENILVNSIDIRQGFLYLINELTNDDYLFMKKNFKNNNIIDLNDK